MQLLNPYYLLVWLIFFFTVLFFSFSLFFFLSRIIPSYRFILFFYFFSLCPFIFLLSLSFSTSCVSLLYRSLQSQHHRVTLTLSRPSNAVHQHRLLSPTQLIKSHPAAPPLNPSPPPPSPPPTSHLTAHQVTALFMLIVAQCKTASIISILSDIQISFDY